MGQNSNTIRSHHSGKPHAYAPESTTVAGGIRLYRRKIQRRAKSALLSARNLSSREIDTADLAVRHYFVDSSDLLTITLSM